MKSTVSHISGASIEHAMVITNFITAVSKQITDKNCRVFADSVEYVLPENDYVSITPDASINCNIHARTEEAFTRAPKFTMIVTEGEQQASILEQLNLYCKIGVAECWVLDWRNKQVDIYGLKNGVELRCTVTDQNKEELQMISFPEWKIAFDELFDFE